MGSRETARSLGLHSSRRSSRRLKPIERTRHPRFEPLECRHVLSAVVGAFLFYDNSHFDGGVTGINPADSAAISDRSAYRPNGTTAISSAVSSYTRGINGIMIDLSAGGSHAAIDASDFVFTIGNTNSTGGWTAAPTPSAVSVSIGGGGGDSDRVEITWPSGSMTNKWLEVQVLGTAHTGLASTDLFFWGNRIADSGSSPPANNFQTDSTDAAQVFATLTAHDGASVTNLRDYNRSGTVDSTDAAIVFASLGVITRLNLTLAPPVLTAGLTDDTAPDGMQNTDTLTSDPTIGGTLNGSAPISSFTGSLNADAAPTDLVSLVQLDGSFTIDPSQLASMHGVGLLADGVYVLHLRAKDANGTTSAADVPFTLKTTVALPGLPDLTDASDTGASSSDNITKDNTPDIAVTGEAGSTIVLWIDGSPAGGQVANPTAVITTPTLSDGPHTIRAYAVDAAGNFNGLSATLSITVDTAAPSVSTTTLVTFTDDQTPHVTVTAAGLPDYTDVRLDVDLNNDGDFADAGETNRTLASLYNGSAYFQLTPALPATDPLAGPYLVQLRSRVSDIAGNEGVSPRTSLKIDTLGNTMLADYVNAPEATFSVSAAPVQTINGLGGLYTVYVYDLHSQTWRTTADVTTPLWQHWMQVIVPQVDLAHLSSTALLMINGGSTSATPPTTLSDTMKSLGQLAVGTNSITINLPNVPNEPLYFTDQSPPIGRTEDQIISYTMDKFVHNLGQPGNETWLALLPMVKSAVKAMTAVQMRDSSAQIPVQINDFVVTGASKRGWTTWLTGAVDNRVKAIIPDVIDLLNLDESFLHHYGFYGFFAEAVGDYTALSLPQNSFMTNNQEIGRVVDPYRYLFNSNLTNIPKLMIDSAGDEFFVPDSAQFYYSDIPGPKYIRYIPNTGHGLDSRATDSTFSFFDAIVNNHTLPQYSWTIDPDGAIRVTSVTAPSQVLVWTATNTAGRDFRNSIGGQPTGVHYDPSAPQNLGGGVYRAQVAAPATGASAFFIELTYPSGLPGIPNYVFTTEIRVVSNTALTPWTFFMPSNPPAPPLSGGGGGGISGDEQNAVAFGLAAALEDSSPAPSQAAPPLPPEVAAAMPSRDEATESLLAQWPWIEEDPAEDDDASAADAIDYVLAGEGLELSL